MRISLISVIVFLSFTLTATAQKKTDWELMGLKGKVKSIRDTEYNMGETEGENKTRHYQFLFNNKGYKTQESMREADQTQFTTTFKYDKSNNLIDESSRLVRSTSSRKYKYDTKNNTVTVNYYVANGVQITKTVQKYDANGNMTERHVENLQDKGQNKVIESYWYAYDGNNRLIEEKQQMGSSIKKIEFKYDENGNRTEQNDFDTEGLPTYWYKYKYDDKGNLVEEVSAFRGYEKDTTTYMYMYDDKGNWTEKREQIGGITQHLTIREISYY